MSKSDNIEFGLFDDYNENPLVESQYHLKNSGTFLFKDVIQLNNITRAVFLKLFLPCGILGQLVSQYLVAPLNAKIDLKVNKIDNWWHP